MVQMVHLEFLGKIELDYASVLLLYEQKYFRNDTFGHLSLSLFWVCSEFSD